MMFLKFVAKPFIRLVGLMSIVVLLLKLAAMAGLPVYNPSNEHIGVSLFGAFLWFESETLWRRKRA